MPFAVNTQEVLDPLVKKYEEAAKRLSASLKHQAQLATIEQQAEYADLCLEVAAGLGGPSGAKLARALAERVSKVAIESDELERKP